MRTFTPGEMFKMPDGDEVRVEVRLHIQMPPLGEERRRDKEADRSIHSYSVMPDGRLMGLCPSGIDETGMTVDDLTHAEPE